MSYKPSLPFSVPAHILTPTTTTVKGVVKKTYNNPTENNLFYCSFRTFGGTESSSNGVYSVVDTANIETWFRPDIKANCRIVLAEDSSKVYEVIGEPENIELRNQFIKFKVQRVTGGA